jgi:ribosomal protein S18 acetylase RimI-like enzyme
MAVSVSISRVADYYARNGFRPTIQRAWLALTRALFANKMVLLYCDLPAEALPPVACPSSVHVELRKSLSEVEAGDLQEMTGFWNPKLTSSRISERFRRGARLWLIKSAGLLAGYGWTLEGQTIEPHYFPLGRHDVHLFDFHVFRRFRGRGINPLLVSHIVWTLAAEGAHRAFIEAAEWNQPQLLSLAKTQFQHFGRARKWTVFGRSIVCWAQNEIHRQGPTPGKEWPTSDS